MADGERLPVSFPLVFLLRLIVSLQNIRVVLVNTSHAGNIGGAARAMKNMGLSRLVLVDRKTFRARMRSPGRPARPIFSIRPGRRHAGRGAGRLQSGAWHQCPGSAHTLAALDPRECAAVSVEQAAAGSDVALVFGREYAGLTNEELQRCQYHVHIPSDPQFSSLNLAATVGAHIRGAHGTVGGRGRPTKVEKLETTAMLDSQPVTVDELENYFGHLEQTLVDIGFLDPAKPRHLMPRLRQAVRAQRNQQAGDEHPAGILTETQKAARGEPHKRRSD